MLLVWNVNQPPFDVALLRQLRPGMSKIEEIGSA
jgi:hypothetical protein